MTSGKWLILAVLVVAIGWYFYEPSGNKPSQAPSMAARAPVFPDGYLALVTCGDLHSFDGKKTLSFEPDHSASREDVAVTKGEKDKGTWTYDGGERYTVKFGGEGKTYRLVSLEESGVCMLVMGSNVSANLEESWFAKTGEDDDPGPYDGPDDR